MTPMSMFVPELALYVTTRNESGTVLLFVAVIVALCVVLFVFTDRFVGALSTPTFESFGVPYLTPLAGRDRGAGLLGLLHLPPRADKTREAALRPRDRRRRK